MKQVIISDSEELLKLLKKDNEDIIGKIKLNLGPLNTNENEKYERLINRWIHACGCETGAVFCFSSICGYLLYWFVRSGDVGVLNEMEGLIIIFSASLIGKLTGIIIAKIRLRWTIKNLLDRLN